ncbi:MAG: hypothetical protein R3230_01160 [Nitrosopumilaceae archaeon]|nr:hypothetical protein [Nitrosopumilaceae archaeon]
MAKIRIYRVVDSDGCGMYRPKTGADKDSLWDMAIKVRDHNHPTVDDDFTFMRNIDDYIKNNKEMFSNPSETLDKIYHSRSTIRILKYFYDGFDYHRYYEFVFGFLNKRQYLKWVYDPQWRYSMNSYGGKLQVWEVEESKVLVGDTQVIFFEMDAELVAEVKPSYFDDNYHHEVYI